MRHLKQIRWERISLYSVIIGLFLVVVLYSERQTLYIDKHTWKVLLSKIVVWLKMRLTLKQAINEAHNSLAASSTCLLWSLKFLWLLWVGFVQGLICLYGMQLILQHVVHSFIECRCSWIWYGKVLHFLLQRKNV